MIEKKSWKNEFKGGKNEEGNLRDSTGVSSRQFSSLSILTFHNVYITRDHKNVRKCIGMCVKLGCRYHSITYDWIDIFFSNKKQIKAYILIYNDKKV